MKWNFNNSGNSPVDKEKLMIYARGIIIKSGIVRDNRLSGILDGPVDSFSNMLIMSRISSLDICAIIKFVDYDFFRIWMVIHQESLELFSQFLDPH